MIRQQTGEPAGLRFALTESLASTQTAPRGILRARNVNPSLVTVPLHGRPCLEVRMERRDRSALQVTANIQPRRPNMIGFTKTLALAGLLGAALLGNQSSGQAC